MGDCLGTGLRQPARHAGRILQREQAEQTPVTGIRLGGLGSANIYLDMLAACANAGPIPEYQHLRGVQAAVSVRREVAGDGIHREGEILRYLFII